VKCNEAQDRLCEYFDKRLDEQARAGVEDHLFSCANCRTEADRLDHTNRLFAALPQVEPPAGFEARWRARLQEEQSKPNLWQRARDVFRNSVPVQAAAVLLIAVLAGFLYQKEHVSESTRQTAPGAGSSEKGETLDRAAPARQAQRQRESEPGTDQFSEASRQDQREQRLQEQAEPKSARPSTGSVPQPESPAVGNRGEYLRAGGEMPVDYQVVVRARFSASDTTLSGTRAESKQSDVPGGSTLSQDQVQTLEQARRRARETGQAQSEVLTIPRAHYEDFKQGLAEIGRVESAAAVGMRETQSAEHVTVLVTIVPAAAPAGSAPTQPSAR
jgi:hypothetical protein